MSEQTAEQTGSQCSDCGLRLQHPAYLNSACPSCDNHRGWMVPDVPTAPEVSHG